MNKAIIIGDEIQISHTLASIIGLQKAIFLEEINSLQKLKELNPEDNSDSFYDGDYWINMTIQKLCDHFPFFSKIGCQDRRPTMRRLIKSLTDRNLLETIEFDNDGSCWYRVKKDSVEKLIKDTPIPPRNQTLKSPEPKKMFWKYNKNKTGI